MKKKAVASWTTPPNGSGHREEQSKNGDSIVYLYTPASNGVAQNLPLTLNFEATLHKSDSNPAAFQPKTAKLILRGKKLKGNGSSSSKGGSVFKGSSAPPTWPVQNLGFLVLQLHQLAGSPTSDDSSVMGDNFSDMSGVDATFTRRLLEQCPFPGSLIHAAVTVALADGSSSGSNSSNNNASSEVAGPNSGSSQNSGSSGGVDSLFASDDPFAAVDSSSPAPLVSSQDGSDFDSYFSAFPADKQRPPLSPTPAGRPRDISDAFDPFSSAPSIANITDDPFAEVVSPSSAAAASTGKDWDDSSFAQWTASQAATPLANGTAPPNRSRNNSQADKEVQRLRNELEALKGVMAGQEQKLQQAADYVAYQEHCLSSLTKQLENATAEYISQSRELHNVKSAKEALEKELMKRRSQEEGKQVGDPAAPLDSSEASNPSLAIALAAESVQPVEGATVVHLSHQLEAAHNEIKRLQLQLLSATSGRPDRESGVDEENSLAALQEKLRQAKEYIDYQAEQIELLQAERPTGGSEDAAATPAAGSDELNVKLQQAAEYIAYQTEQLEAANEEIEQLKATLEAASSGLHSAAPDSSAQSMQEQLKQAAARASELELKIIESNKLHDKEVTLLREEMRQMIQKLEISEAAAEALRQAAAEADRKAAEAAGQVEKEKRLSLQREKETVAATAASFAAAAGRERQLEKLKLQDAESAQKLSSELQQAEEIIKYQSEQLKEKGVLIVSLEEALKQVRAELDATRTVHGSSETALSTSEAVSDDLREQLQQAALYIAQLSEQIEVC